jgi:hypothetical protein
MTAWERLTAGEFLLEVLLAIAGAAVSVISGYRYAISTPPRNDLAIASYVFAAVVFLILFCRARARNKKAQNEDELHALIGVLYALHAIL